MDLDPNDLLNTNIFVNEPVLTDEIPEELNEEFKNFYKKEIERKNEEGLLKKLESRDILSSEDVMNEPFIKQENKTTDVKRVKKEVKSLVSVDSRDRNKVVYPLASNFKIFLGKTYYNVKQVRLVSIEFPNTNAVINSKNNLIYWRNQEDIDLDLLDDITQTYPVYRAPLRIGSYVASTLQTEMINQMNLIKRKNPPNYHYFVITLDFDTDIVRFISLILKSLNVNPLTTIVNTGVITVTAHSHGYSTGDSVYILGATNTAGIPASILNGFQKVTVLDGNTFQYEVNVNANETVNGGGNVVKTGRSAPFQFLFGEYSNTVAQNIGYPLENSSTLISSAISSITNFYQIEITAVDTNFSLSYEYVSNNIILQNSGVFLDNNGTPGNSIDGVRKITNVLNSKTFLVNTTSPLYESVFITQVENDSGTGDIVSKPTFITSLVSDVVTDNKKIVLPAFLTASDDYYTGWWILITSGDAINNVRQIVSYVSATNTITLNTPLTTTPALNDTFNIYSAPTFTFQSKVYRITRIRDYNINTVLFTFFVPHNYTFNHINRTIPLYNTTSNPTFDGDNIILGVPSPTTLYIAGSVLPGGSVTTSNPGEIGYTPTHNTLTTKTLNISNVLVGNITTIVTTEEHGLSVGDKISIKNLLISPPLTLFDYAVYTVPDMYTFTIQFYSSSVDLESIQNAYVGTDIITIDFPDHGFNFIVSVINGPTNNTVDIQTQLPHNLNTGDLIRIMETGIEYIDNDSYTISKLTSDTFRITVSLPSGYVVNSSTGVLGMSNTFRLYNCPVVGGIEPRFLNNVLFKVHEIIDKDTFNFHILNAYAQTTESNGINIYISSYKHGFSATQTNTKNGVLNRSINLEGENYAFLCSPQLSTVLNTGTVKDIFARIILDQSPGMVVFNFLSNPKKFENTPLSTLDTIDFSVLNYDGSEYIFNDLDYSFTLEITEIVDTTENFNLSSKRGVTDII
jgi:hypothetical protein